VVRVAVLVSGGGTNLQALMDAARRGDMPHVSLSLVVGSRPGIYALERAAHGGIPRAVLQKGKEEPLEEYGQRLIQLLAAHQIDLVVLAGFLTILPHNVIAQFQGRIINIHPSLIPAFSGKGFYGLKVHEAALARGVKVTGATVHFVNEVPDGGEIIAQQAVTVLPGDTPEILQRRVMEEAEWLLLPRAVEETASRLDAQSTTAGR